MTRSGKGTASSEDAAGVTSTTNAVDAISATSEASVANATTPAAKREAFRAAWQKTMVAAAALALCFAFAFTATGCGSSDGMAGHWECVAVSNGSESYELQDLGLDGAAYMTLDLDSSGSVKMTAMGEDVDSTGLTWEETQDGVSLNSDVGTMDALYDAETGRLTLDYLGQAVILEKR